MSLPKKPASLLDLDQMFNLPKEGVLSDYRATIEKYKSNPSPDNYCLSRFDIKGKFLLKNILDDARDATFIGRYKSFPFYEEALADFLESKTGARVLVRFYDVAAVPRLNQRFDPFIGSLQANFSTVAVNPALQDMEMMCARMNGKFHSWIGPMNMFGLQQALVNFNVPDDPGSGLGRRANSPAPSPAPIRIPELV